MVKWWDFKGFTYNGSLWSVIRNLGIKIGLMKAPRLVLQISFLILALGAGASPSQAYDPSQPQSFDPQADLTNVKTAEFGTGRRRQNFPGLKVADFPALHTRMIFSKDGLIQPNSK